MLSRQRSTCFILENNRVQGSDFVEMLRLIGYPGASGLKGEDFDWLCEGNEEVEQLLGWLCGVVDQRNALSDEQLEAYNDLLASGKPLLQADELQSLCRREGGDDGDLDLEERKTLDELEAEVQSLRNLKTHRLRTRNKLESLGLTFLCSHLSLEKSEKEEEKNLIHIKEGLASLNTKCNAALTRLREVVKELGGLHSPLVAPKLFLSLLDLGGHIGLENTCWGQVEDLSKELLPGRNEEREQKKRLKREIEAEGERVRTAWASQRVQLSLTLGTLHGKEEAFNWVHRTREEQLWDPQQVPSLEREIQSLEAEVEALQTQRLPSLVCEASLGPCLPSHHEWLRAEKQRLKQVEQGQVPLKEAALHQLSRLQLIEMGLHAERRTHRQTERDLQGLRGEMATRATELGRRLQGPRDLWASSQWLSPIRIASKDHTAVRLSIMLNEPTSRKELFPKYEALQHKGALLVQEVASLGGVLHGPLPQVSSLEAECNELYQSLCRGTRNLQLIDPALTHSFEALYTCVSQFNQWCLDCLRDLERKKHSIQTSRLEQERRLYVLFYQDPTALASTIQELEQRVRELESQ
ncbi:HAUS augmin-like complex subunit 3 [Spea bombifrons]|uniref:HAUS augmin-like complex subunit 3 n=1 Tax=Spea bombifrons TaxID=233779 RepID=UPI00234ABF21|nr:HAUS augmin-like complex subunit 3 [Spea bombifrons]